MSRFLFFLIIKPLSLLPLRYLYVLSGFFYLLFYRVFRFRKKVVLTNLRNAFPERGEEELQGIARRFYRHLMDVLVEGVRMFSMPGEEALLRMRVVNSEVLDQFFEQGKSVVIAAGHYNNWEWAATVLPPQIKHAVVGVYKPLSNPYSNQKFAESRARFGLELISTKAITDFLAANTHRPLAVIMGTDQSPTFSKRVYWTRFLNQDTAVMTGTERYSRAYDYPVIFGKVKKRARGYYEMSFSLIEEHPAQTPEGWITEQHTRLLETQILEAPEFWLWTHKRWKRKR